MQFLGCSKFEDGDKQPHIKDIGASIDSVSVPFFTFTHTPKGRSTKGQVESFDPIKKKLHF